MGFSFEALFAAQKHDCGPRMNPVSGARQREPLIDFGIAPGVFGRLPIHQPGNISSGVKSDQSEFRLIEGLQIDGRESGGNSYASSSSLRPSGSESEAAQCFPDSHDLM